MQNMVRLSLADLEAEVRCVSGVMQMQRLCRKMLFDLIIVLYTSPFLCGYDLVRALRPGGLRRPLFYVVSWQQSEHTVLSLLESGVDQYMTFPISLQRLRGKVSNELGRRL